MKNFVLILSIFFFAFIHSDDRKFSFSQFQDTDLNTFLVCIQLVFFLNISNSHKIIKIPNGAVSIMNNSLKLTNNFTNQIGSVWYDDRVLIDGFDISFTFLITDLQNDVGLGGNSGITFVIQNKSTLEVKILK